MRSIDLARRVYGRLPEPLRAAARRAYSEIPFPWRHGWSFGAFSWRLSRSQWLSSAELEELQRRKLRRVVRHAWETVPAYRRQFEQCGLHWRDIQRPDELALLPLTKKTDLQDSPDEFISSAFDPSHLSRRTTSGSTGTPLNLVHSRWSKVAESAVMHRGWWWSGYRPGDRVAVCVGELTPPIEGPDHAPVARYRDSLDFCPHHLDRRGVDAYLDELVRFGPRFVRTYPSIALILGERLEERGLCLPSVRAIWTQSEILTDEHRDRIERHWQSPVFDYYGMQERCIAMSECEHQRLHLHSEFGLLELIPSEEPGLCQVVATGFCNPAMPLLRYQTRDLAVPDDRSPCPCGRALPTVRRILGRMEDYLSRADGSRVMEMDAVIGELSHIRECQLVQEQVDFVRVLVVPGPGFEEAHRDDIVRRARAELGANMKITVELRDGLPRTKTGKRRFIVSKLPGAGFDRHLR